MIIALQQNRSLVPPTGIVENIIDQLQKLRPEWAELCHLNRMKINQQARIVSPKRSDCLMALRAKSLRGRQPEIRCKAYWFGKACPPYRVMPFFAFKYKQVVTPTDELKVLSEHLGNPDERLVEMNNLFTVKRLHACRY